LRISFDADFARYTGSAIYWQDNGPIASINQNTLTMRKLIFD